MKRVNLLLAAALCCTFAGLAQAQSEEKVAHKKPFLWKVELPGAKTPSYLFGTIHLPDKRVITLPKVVNKAVDRCDALYCELALEPSLQMKAMPHMMLPEGKTLKDVVGEKNFERASALLSAKGIPIMALQRLKPWAFQSQVQMLDYMPQLQAGVKPLDAGLYTRAKQAGKTVGGLEKIEDQLSVFNSMSEAYQKKSFGEWLDGLDKAKKEGVNPLEQLIEGYLEGDSKKLSDLIKEEMGKSEDEEAKKLMKRLIDDRNGTMTKRILELSKESPDKCFFFAVGTAHYPGKTGILKQLEAKGATITRLELGDADKVE